MNNQNSDTKETNNTLRRMRTIKELASHYSNLDPDTAITQYFIRQQLLSGKLPFVPAGSKRLVAIEDMDAFLINATIKTTQETQQGQIRRID